MTVDLFIDLLRAHRAALQSSVWPEPHSASSGPALYLDAADTEALIAALTQTEPAETPGVEHELIARRAYALYERRGRAHGHDWDDWLQAERELRRPTTEAAHATSTRATRPKLPRPLWFAPRDLTGDSDPYPETTA
jgi:hypothetical protein